jgi:hypothetical protein
MGSTAESLGSSLDHSLGGLGQSCAASAESDPTGESSATGLALAEEEGVVVELSPSCSGKH